MDWICVEEDHAPQASTASRSVNSDSPIFIRIPKFGWNYRRQLGGAIMQIRQKYVYGDGRRLDGQRFAESQLARATGVNQSNLVKFFHFEIPFPDFLSFSLSLSRFAITRLLQVSGTCIKSNENLTRKNKTWAGWG